MKLGKCNFCKEKVCEVRKYYYIMDIIKTFLKALDILIVTYLKGKCCLYKAITKSESKIYVSWKKCIYNNSIYLHCIFAIGLQNNICTCTTKQYTVHRHFDCRVGVSPNVMHRCRIVLLFMFLKANLDRRQLHLIKKSCKKMGWQHHTVSVYTIASHIDSGQKKLLQHCNALY